MREFQCRSLIIVQHCIFHTTLNDYLLTGPDITNTLVGVPCHFRKGQIAIMCNIERMFYQFHVAKEHQVYLWMKAMWIPKHHEWRYSCLVCSNFGLKYLAWQAQEKFSEQSIKFIQRHFYVDYCLTIVKSSAEESCQRGKSLVQNRKPSNTQVCVQQ